MRLALLVLLLGQLAAVGYQQIVVGDSHSSNQQWTNHAAQLLAAQNSTAVDGVGHWGLDAS